MTQLLFFETRDIKETLLAEVTIEAINIGKFLDCIVILGSQAKLAV